jgi:hypothetical protein
MQYSYKVVINNHNPTLTESDPGKLRIQPHSACWVEELACTLLPDVSITGALKGNNEDPPARNDKYSVATTASFIYDVKSELILADV